MNWRSPQVWIAAFSAVGVLGIALIDIGRKAPGELAAVHGRIDGLASDCSACHGGWGTSMSEACLECHGAISAQLESAQGLHGQVSAEISGHCSLCHGEHYGQEFPLVNVRSFALAGVSDPTAFDHERIGFSMAGKHLELACTECHANAEVPVLKQGEQRFLGLSQDCASCHEDPHAGRMAGACVDCHNQLAFEPIAPSNHERFLALRGAHAQADCRDCHAQEETHALESLRRGERSPSPRDCLACHDSPHRERFEQAAAEFFADTQGNACSNCHTSEHASFRSSERTLSPEEHALSGFVLARPHDRVACTACHDSSLSNFEERYPGREQGACSNCHADPHQGQFRDGPFANQECTACHATEAFEPHAFSVELHAQSKMALDGAHLAQDCRTCHVDPPPNEARLFEGIAHQCSSCHEDAHGGFFDDRVNGVTLPEHGACALCHDTTDFGSDWTAQEFQHARWTGFAVSGAHAQAECGVCHPPEPAANPQGRSFGRVADHFGVYSGCKTCHLDPHAGQFDAPQLPQSLGGRSDCARCHSDSSFRELPHDFDHGLWTGYSLEGAHAELNCSSCHQPYRKPTLDGRTWARAKGTACADCHNDPHAGQFISGASTDCSRCHESTNAFQELSFNHEFDSRFPLGEAHSPLSCSACHKPIADQDPTIRYRPLPTDCADCHGRQDHPLRRGRGRKG